MRLPTLSGEVDLMIEEGVQPDDTKRLRGKGVHNKATNKQGDMYVTLKIEIPKMLSPMQKSILQMLQGSPEGQQQEMKQDDNDDCSAKEKIKNWIKNKVSGSSTDS